MAAFFYNHKEVISGPYDCYNMYWDLVHVCVRGQAIDFYKCGQILHLVCML